MNLCPTPPHIFEKSLSVATSLNSRICSNDDKIASLEKDLAEYDKNPNFYRNNKIVKIAAAVAIVAVAALATSCLIAVAIGTLGGGFLAAGTAGGIVLGMQVLPPSLGVLALVCIFKDFSKNAEGDREILQTLQKKNKELQGEKQTVIDILQSTLELHQAATAETFSQEGWEAMIKALETPSLNNIKDEAVQQRIWQTKKAVVQGYKEKLTQQLEILVPTRPEKRQ